MKQDYIDPILDSLSNILATMAMMESAPGKVELKNCDLAKGDVTGIISMVSPSLTGSLAVSFSKKVILDIASNMLGETFTEIDGDIEDCVGEITNMMTGGAKTRLEEKGYDFEMATPIVVSGEGHKIKHDVDGNLIVVPVNTDSGEFYVEICLKPCS